MSAAPSLAWRVRAGMPADRKGWAQLRQALWPADDLQEQIADLMGFVAEGGAGFVAQTDDGELIGFAEASLRHDYVNGTQTSPVGFLEGWYVAPAWRRHGVGRALVAAVAAWARDQGCSELASDAPQDNLVSHAAHAACGLRETERVVYFRMALDD